MAKKQTRKNSTQEKKAKNRRKRRAIALGISIPLVAAGAGVGIYFGVKSCSNKLQIKWLGSDKDLGSFTYTGNRGEDIVITFTPKNGRILDVSSLRILVNGRFLKQNIDFTVNGNKITINASATNADIIYLYARSTIAPDAQKGTVELTSEVATQVSVKAKSIEKNKESTFELTMPESSKITAMTLKIGSSTLTYPGDFTIVDNVVTIPADKVIDSTVTVTSITLKTKEISGLTLTAETKTLKINQSFTIAAAVSYETNDYTINWSADDEGKVIALSKTTSAPEEEITITAKAKGNAILKAECGSHSATCSITVTDQAVTVTGIEVQLVDSSKSYQIGDSITEKDLVVKLIYNDTSKSDPINWGGEKTSGDYYSIGIRDEKGSMFEFEGFDKGHIIGSNSAFEKAGKSCEYSVYYKKDDTICDTFTINIEVVALQSISLNTDKLSLQKGKTSQLTYTLNPTNATHNEVKWKTSDEGVATVENGLVTAVAKNTCTITCYSSYDENIKATCTVTVDEGVVYVTGVNLNKTTLSLDVGKKEKLYKTITPSNATTQTVQWKTSDPNVATVNDDGEVEAIKGGTANITVTTDDGGFTDTCVVTVPEAPTGITLNPTELSLVVGGESKKIGYTVTPEGASQSVTWDSDDEAVCTVDDEGNVTAVAEGDTLVHCTSTVATGVTAACSVHVSPAKVYYKGVDYETKRDNECLVTAGADAWDSEKHEWNIPEKLIVDGKEKTVTGVKDLGFDSSPLTTEKRELITSIKFDNPSNITYIGWGAFSGNEKITTFDFPDNVETLPKHIFWGCNALATLNFGASSKLKTIKDEVLSYCSSFKSITLPQSLETIEANAFKESGLTSATFKGTANWRQTNNIATLVVSSDPTANAAKLMEFSESAENNWGYTGITTTTPQMVGVDSTTGSTCTVKISALGKLETETLTIPDSITVEDTNTTYAVTGIADYGLEGCVAKHIQLPSSLKTIGTGAFYNLPSLLDISIPDGVTTIPNNAFQKCTSLATVTLPTTGLLTIGDNAFSETPITNISLPEGLGAIGASAFESCASLESINIPSTVITMGESVLEGSGSATNGLNVNFDGTSTLDTIPSSAFRQSKLKTIVIPASVITISARSFFSCGDLTSVAFAENSKLEKIGESAFETCSSLSTFTIPASTQSIDKSAFVCTTGGLSTVIFDNTIGWKAKSNTVYEDVTDPAENAKQLKSTSWEWAASGMHVVEPSALEVTSTTHHVTADTSISFAGLKAKFGGLDVTTESKWSISGTGGVLTIDENTGLVHVQKVAPASATVTATYTYNSKNYSQTYELEVGSWDKIGFNSNGEVVHSDPTYTKGEIVIPSRRWDNSGNQVAVTAIAASGFSNYAGITKVYIGSGIKYIYSEAFKECTSLTDVYFSDAEDWIQTTGSSISVSNSSTNANNLKDVTGTSATGANWGKTGIEKITTSYTLEWNGTNFGLTEGGEAQYITLKADFTYKFNFTGDAEHMVDLFYLKDQTTQQGVEFTLDSSSTIGMYARWHSSASGEWGWHFEYENKLGAGSWTFIIQVAEDVTITPIAASLS